MAWSSPLEALSRRSPTENPLVRTMTVSRSVFGRKHLQFCNNILIAMGKHTTAQSHIALSFLQGVTILS